jgi:hypothetical protein
MQATFFSCAIYLVVKITGKGSNPYQTVFIILPRIPVYRLDLVVSRLLFFYAISLQEMLGIGNAFT